MKTAPPPETFRAIWPIVDETVPFSELCREAMKEVPRLAAQAHARPQGVGRFLVAPSDIVAGSGRRPLASVARVGKEQTYNTPDHEACSRCGRVRKVYRSVAKPRGDMCRDCIEVEAA